MARHQLVKDAQGLHMRTYTRVCLGVDPGSSAVPFTLKHVNCVGLTVSCISSNVSIALLCTTQVGLVGRTWLVNYHNEWKRILAELQFDLN